MSLKGGRVAPPANDLQPQRRADACALVATTLRRFDYALRGKTDKGLLRRFLSKATGLSRAQDALHGTLSDPARRALCARAWRLTACRALRVADARRRSGSTSTAASQPLSTSAGQPYCRQAAKVIDAEHVRAAGLPRRLRQSSG